MWSLECKHQMLTHDGRRTTDDDGQPLTTIAHHEHFVECFFIKHNEIFFSMHVFNLSFFVRNVRKKRKPKIITTPHVHSNNDITESRQNETIVKFKGLNYRQAEFWVI